MSTDSTELTFVRCPSCRSLVPAMSTRCRMCGATLDSASAGEKEEDKKQGRVRQRTMSAPEKGVASVVEKLRAEFSPKLDNGSAETKESAQAEKPVREAAEEKTSAADPLQAFIQEIDEAAPQDEDAEEVSEEQDIDIKAGAESDTADEWDSSEEDDEEDEDGSSEEDEKTIPPQKTGASLEEKEAGRPGAETGRRYAQVEAPRVIVESGRPRKGKGLSFSKKDGKESFRKDNRESKPFVRKDDRKAEPHTEPPSSFADRQRRDEQHNKQNVKPASQQERPQRDPVKAQRGRLVGWLVSYEQPDGEAIELREGKFFVTASSLKESDLILDDSSISTPHAMVSVGAEGKLVVQDLMSERGVFVRSGRRDTYRREEEPFEVENGDWLRFGDIEFLISLIAHVGEK